MGRSTAVAAAPSREGSGGAPAEPRKLAVNFVFLSCGEFTAKLLTFASFSFLARNIGPWRYGLLEFTLALMVFFTLPVDLGLGSYGAREIARDPKRAARLLHEITGLRLLLALVSMAALGLFILAVDKPLEQELLLALYGLSLLGGPFLLQWYFQAHDQMHWVGLASIVRQAGFAALVFWMGPGRKGVLWMGVVECLSVAAAAAFCVYVTRRRMHAAWPWPDLRIRRLLGHLREVWAIGLTELAWAFMWYFCTVLLGLVFSDWTLGWFGASHRVLMALHTFVWLYFFNLLPSISRCMALPSHHLLELSDRSMRFAAWVGVFAAGLLTVVAPVVLTMIYGPAFRDASGSFSILAWMLPVAMVSGHHRYILVAYNHQKRLLYCTAVSAVAAVGLSFALVPLYGGQGAAWALLIANAVNLALVYVAVRQLVVKVPIGPQLTAPLVALGAAAVAYFCLLGWNYWVAVGVACVVYLGGLVRTDGRQLLSFVQAVVRKPAVKSGRHTPTLAREA